MQQSPVKIVAWPVRVLEPPGAESRVTNEFNRKTHLGVDISVPDALTTAVADVVAVADGRVVRAYKSARGWAVLLGHGDWTSAYLHMTGLAVDVGDVVLAGQKLGRMGADPMDSEHIVHLHLQVAVNGQVQDPGPYLADKPPVLSA